MKNLGLFILSVASPFILIRFCVLHRSFQKVYIEGFFYSKILRSVLGCIQDLLISLQFLFLYFYGSKYIEIKHIYLSLFSFLYSLIILDSLVDAFLYKSTQLRLEAPFFSFMGGIKCFWDSAKEKKIAWLFPLLILFFIILMTFFYYIFQNISFYLDRNVYLLSITIFLIWILSVIFLPKHISYGLDNIFLAQQFWLLKRGYDFFSRVYNLKKTQVHAKKKILLPGCEKYSSISSRYPLLKYTHGFFGEKQCDIQMDENKKPHIVLLFLESFRAKDVGVLGGKFGITPCFDELSREGHLFKNFYANSIKTTRSVSSTLFGIPSDINSSEISSRIGMPFISLAYLLSKHGYESIYHHNGLLEFENQTEFFSKYGYKELVGRDDILKRYPKAPLTSWGVHDEYLMRYSADVLEKKIKEARQPIFLTMFTISNHHPWTLPTDMRKTSLNNIKDLRYEKFLYTMNYSDYCLGEFIKILREKKLTEDIVFFILGDHGYPMGEHHNNHVEQRYLYEENVKVPLLILSDGRIKDPQHLDEPGSQIDLIPTIMDLCKMKGLNHARGTTLLRKAERQVFFHNPYAYRFYGTRKGPYKLIYTKSSKELELYDLVLDPDERYDISGKFPEISTQYLQDVKDYHEYYKSLYDNKRFSPFELDSSGLVLNFSKLSKYSSYKLLSEIKKYPFILHLDLSHCDLLSDETLKEIIKRHKELKSLNISCCEKLTEKSLQYINQYCENLKFINISNCLFSREEINYFAKNSLDLERIIRK